MAAKPRKRVVTLKVNDIKQIVEYFNNRHSKKIKAQETYTDGTPFGVLRFWR